MPRVTIVDADKISDEAAAAVAEVWQTVNGALRVKLHDKHAALVSIGRYLGMFDDKVKVRHQRRADERRGVEQTIREGGVMCACLMAGRGGPATRAIPDSPRTKSGQPCRSPATKKGRCRLHGGASGSGGPPGERNGQYRHGERTKAAIAEQRKFSALLKMLRAGLT
jgi:hypothetical protein